MARRISLKRSLWLGLLLATLLAAGYTLYLDYRVRDEFEGRRTTKLLPLELHAGLKLPLAAVEQELRDLGYRDAPREGEAGWFAKSADGLEIAVRRFVFWDGAQPERRLRVSFDDKSVSSLRDGQGADVPLARLEPRLIGGIYPANNEDRALVRRSEVPKDLVNALIATEDRTFYTHAGFSPRALARASMSLFSGHLQGGSMLTRQLVEDLLGRPVDLVTDKGLRRVLRPYVEKELVLVA